MKATRASSIDVPRLVMRYAAVIVLIALIVVFSITLPETFPTVDNFKTVVLTQSVLVLIALGLLAPLVTGEFDLSVGSAAGFGGLVAAKLVSSGMTVPLVILIVLAAGIAIGLINSFLIVRLEVSSFIATLGTGIIISGATLWISNGKTVYEHIGASFTNLGDKTILGFLPLPGLYVILLAVFLWYLLERTPLGREMYVTGYGREAARLAGIRMGSRICLGFVISASVACMAGLVNAASLGSAGPNEGTAFLLPCFAAAFLGSTTLKVGRFNVGGTLVAAALLAVGITGLQLMGAQPYIRNFFYGVALITSVAFSQLGVRRLRERQVRAR